VTLPDATSEVFLEAREITKPVMDRVREALVDADGAVRPVRGVFSLVSTEALNVRPAPLSPLRRPAAGLPSPDRAPDHPPLTPPPRPTPPAAPVRGPPRGAQDLGGHGPLRQGLLREGSDPPPREGRRDVHLGGRGPRPGPPARAVGEPGDGVRGRGRSSRGVPPPGPRRGDHLPPGRVRGRLRQRHLHRRAAPVRLPPGPRGPDGAHGPRPRRAGSLCHRVVLLPRRRGLRRVDAERHRGVLLLRVPYSVRPRHLRRQGPGRRRGPRCRAQAPGDLLRRLRHGARGARPPVRPPRRREPRLLRLQVHEPLLWAGERPGPSGGSPPGAARGGR